MLQNLSYRRCHSLIHLDGQENKRMPNTVQDTQVTTCRFLIDVGGANLAEEFRDTVGDKATDAEEKVLVAICGSRREVNPSFSQRELFNGGRPSCLPVKGNIFASDDQI